MEEWFVINDIHEFTNKARAIVYNNFGSCDEEKNQIDVLIDAVADNEKEEFDKILSEQESVLIVKQIVKKQKNKKDGSFRYVLNDKLFVEIIENLNSRMVSNIINNLVQKGLIETGFDNESNDFIFWIKDNESKEEEKPETD